MIILKTYTGRRIEDLADILFYTVKDGVIKFIVTPKIEEKVGGMDSKGEIKCSSEALMCFKTFSKRIEQIEPTEDGNVDVKYKDGTQIKYNRSLSPRLYEIKEEQNHYDNDGVNLTEGENYSKSRGKAPGCLIALITAGLAFLALGQIPAVKNTISDLVGIYFKDDYSVYTEDLKSTGNRETDTLGSTLFGIIMENNLPILKNGFRVGDTIITADENLVRDAVALFNGETPASMEGLSKEDYAIRASAIAQFWVEVVEVSLNPNNPVFINPADYAKDLDVRALINNSMATSENFVRSVAGLTPNATFISSRTEDVKLDQPFKNIQETFIGYQYQTETDSVLETASPTANYIVFSAFTYGNEKMQETSYIYEGTINGENVTWPYIYYINQATRGMGLGGYTWKPIIEEDGKTSFVEYNATGRKTGVKLSQNEMQALAESDVDVVPQGFSTEMNNMKTLYLGEIQKKPGVSYTKR